MKITDTDRINFIASSFSCGGRNPTWLVTGEFGLSLREVVDAAIHKKWNEPTKEEK